MATYHTKTLVRNWHIYQLRQSGVLVRVVAQQYNMSTSRVTVIHSHCRHRRRHAELYNARGTWRSLVGAQT